MTGWGRDGRWRRVRRVAGRVRAAGGGERGRARVAVTAAAALPGDISTVAGTGSPGYAGDGGPATSASLCYPSGVAVDGSGNVFVADTNNSRVRKVDASGTITTVAGTGSPGYAGDGGPAIAAKLANARGVAVDGSGNVFVADTSNDRVREVEGLLVPSVTTTSVALTTTSVPVTTTTLPSVLTGYPSDGCAAGANAATGWVGGAYSSLRTLTSGSTTSVCAAVEAGGAHAGGKVTVNTGTPATPSLDGHQSRCADPAYPGDYQLIRDVGILGHPFKVDAKIVPSAASPSEVWVCVLADTTAQRVVVPVSTGGTPSFLADSTAPHTPAYPVNPPLAGKASSACQASGGETGRRLNTTVGTTQAWVYTWQESASRAHVCVRVGDTGGGDGGRLTVDTNGGVTLVANDASSDRTPCPQQIVDDAGPPAYWLYTSNPGATPAWACVMVGTSPPTFLRVKLDPGGGQGIATFTRDT